MNRLGLVNKVAVENSLTLGRAEMIVSIITGSILDSLRTGQPVAIPGFGTFKISERKRLEKGFASHTVSFSPDENFLNIVNS